MCGRGTQQSASSIHALLRLRDASSTAFAKSNDAACLRFYFRYCCCLPALPLPTNCLCLRRLLFAVPLPAPVSLPAPTPSACLPLLAFIFLVASFLVLLTVLVPYTYICIHMCVCAFVCVYVCKHVFGAAFWKCEMPMKCNKA